MIDITQAGAVVIMIALMIFFLYLASLCYREKDMMSVAQTLAVAILFAIFAIFVGRL